jgi:hypothetical protein
MIVEIRPVSVELSVMSLTPEQKQAVAQWVAAGDSLSAIQKKLADEFKLSLTYMDVRFLVDDLNLALKDKTPSPTPAATLPEKPVEKKGLLDKAKEKLGLGGSTPADEPSLDDEDVPEAEFEPAEGAGLGGKVSVAVDKVTLLPGALASGTVTFSDGVTGKWIVDNYGRPGLTEVSRPGYRPTPADAQAFMQELGALLQQRGY